MLRTWEIGNRDCSCPHHCLKLSNQQSFSHVAVHVSNVKKPTKQKPLPMSPPPPKPQPTKKPKQTTQKTSATVCFLVDRSLVHKLLSQPVASAYLAGCLRRTGTDRLASSCLTWVLSPQPPHQHGSAVRELCTIL